MRWLDGLALILALLAVVLPLLLAGWLVGRSDGRPQDTRVEPPTPQRR